jgi:hypothetical protein
MQDDDTARRQQSGHVRNASVGPRDVVQPPDNDYCLAAPWFKGGCRRVGSEEQVVVVLLGQALAGVSVEHFHRDVYPDDEFPSGDQGDGALARPAAQVDNKEGPFNMLVHLAGNQFLAVTARRQGVGEKSIVGCGLLIMKDFFIENHVLRSLFRRGRFNEALNLLLPAPINREGRGEHVDYPILGGHELSSARSAGKADPLIWKVCEPLATVGTDQQLAQAH